MLATANKTISQCRVSPVSPLKRQKIIVRRRPGTKYQCLMRFGHRTYRASWGKNGITIFKREGDGKTPIAKMPLVEGFYKDRLRHRNHTSLKMRPIRPFMGWCDAPNHPCYNQLVRKPFAHSHENMLRPDGLYDVVLVLDWNITRRRKGGGSAIFCHIARDQYAPTDGCLALSKRDIWRILPFLTRATRIEIKG